MHNQEPVPELTERTTALWAVDGHFSFRVIRQGLLTSGNLACAFTVLDSFSLQIILETRLTYNCAHLRSKVVWMKFFLGENYWGENYLGEIFWGRKFFR